MSKYQPSLARLAQRAQAQDSLLASVLIQYQQTQHLSDLQLALWLECPPERIANLALCRKPRPSPFFRPDVEQIAAYVQANPERLAQLIRSVETRRALQGNHRQALLFAARDHDEEDQPSEPEPEQ